MENLEKRIWRSNKRSTRLFFLKVRFPGSGCEKAKRTGLVEFQTFHWELKKTGD